MSRERFGSRLGFILVSAGCAIGLGNVWKFPYMCGQFGGAAFVLVYLLFLVILGLPVIVAEFAVGRGSQRSIGTSFDTLTAGKGWGKIKWFGIVGNYMLMMFYTMVCGWMFYYFVKMVKGDFIGATPASVGAAFDGMLASPGILVLFTVITCILGFGVCFIGMQKGVERITKWMMSFLLVIMIVLAVHSVTLDGASEGLKFYLVPNFNRMVENGVGNMIFGALSQAFFTLSIGIGSMAIFGSYLNKDRSLTGEAVNILCLDTFVALTAGLIIIPACFAFGVDPGAGPGLIFVTLPNIFAQMKGGVIWGSLFFLFMCFAAFSTVIAVFENIISYVSESLNIGRRKSIVLNLFMMILLSLPAVFGFNLLSGFQPLGDGSGIMDLEDFIVSNNLLPLGSLAYVLFCVRKNGWGWDNFLEEVNAGKGMKFPKGIKWYMAFVLPTIIVAIYLKGYYDMFSKQGAAVLTPWMLIAVLMLTFVFSAVFCKVDKNAVLIKETSDPA